MESSQDSVFDGFWSLVAMPNSAIVKWSATFFLEARVQ
jgi:hypothetical protein